MREPRVREERDSPLDRPPEGYKRHAHRRHSRDEVAQVEENLAEVIGVPRVPPDALGAQSPRVRRHRQRFRGPRVAATGTRVTDAIAAAAAAAASSIAAISRSTVAEQGGVLALNGVGFNPTFLEG